MNDSTAAAAYVGQLAERVAELVPDMGTPARLGLLGVMEPGDLRTSLAFIASMFPQVFDFALVRDRAMTERLVGRLGEDQADDEDPYCSACGAAVGIFQGQQARGWQHFRSEGTVSSPVELFDAGHEAVIALRPAGAR